MSKYILLFVVAVSFFGCKTMHFKKSEVLANHHEMNALKDRIDRAIATDVDILAPKHFDQAKDLFDQAVKEVQNGKYSDSVNQSTQSGLVLMAQAENIAAKSRDILGDALNKRDFAQKAEAHVLFEAEFIRL